MWCANTRCRVASSISRHSRELANQLLVQAILVQRAQLRDAVKAVGESRKHILSHLRCAPTG